MPISGHIVIVIVDDATGADCITTGSLERLLASIACASHMHIVHRSRVHLPLLPEVISNVQVTVTAISSTVGVISALCAVNSSNAVEATSPYLLVMADALQHISGHLELSDLDSVRCTVVSLVGDAKTRYGALLLDVNGSIADVLDTHNPLQPKSIKIAGIVALCATVAARARRQLHKPELDAIQQLRRLLDDCWWDARLDLVTLHR